MRQVMPAPRIWAGGVRPPRRNNMEDQHHWVIAGARPGAVNKHHKVVGYYAVLRISERWMIGDWI